MAPTATLTIQYTNKYKISFTGMLKGFGACIRIALCDICN